MNLSRLLAARAEAGKPVRVGLIGAGKFGAMFLAQARRTTGLHVLCVADLDIARARGNARAAGWSDERLGAPGLDAAAKGGATHVGDDAAALIAHPALDVVIDATGDPKVGIRHCLAAIDNGKHIVMVNVEADVVAGPLLARRAEQAGVVYSLAWGDQPALVAEHVDLGARLRLRRGLRRQGHALSPRLPPFDAGYGVGQFPFRPRDRRTRTHEPQNVQLVHRRHQVGDRDERGVQRDRADAAAGRPVLPALLALRPGGDAQARQAPAAGQPARAATEVVSSLHRDMSPVENDLMLGHVRRDRGGQRLCPALFRGITACCRTSTFRYGALYRPTHMIGLELGVSVASAALRGEPTGAPTGFRSDVVACAKRPLKKGELLDGEGGYMVWGKQVPAADSLAAGGLPLGLAAGVPLTRDIAEGELLSWSDAAIDRGRRRRARPPRDGGGVRPREHRRSMRVATGI